MNGLIYVIDHNGMHLGSSQEDISDQFFGSDSPLSYLTDYQRHQAMAQWLDNEWITKQDRIVWDGHHYTPGLLNRTIYVVEDMRGSAVGLYYPVDHEAKTHAALDLVSDYQHIPNSIIVDALKLTGLWGLSKVMNKIYLEAILQNAPSYTMLKTYPMLIPVADSIDINYSSKQVCDKLGITRRTLTNWIKAGKISPIDPTASRLRFRRDIVNKLS